MARGRPKQKPVPRSSNPEFVEEALDRLSDPAAKLRAVARDMGDTGRENETIRNALRRIAERLERTGQLAAFQRVGEVKRETLIGLLDEVSFNTLSSIDEYDLATASLKDKMIAVGIALEKRQLLRGEPTAILSHEERLRLPDLIAAGMAELQRRGMAIELTKTDYAVEGVGPEARVLPMAEDAVAAREEHVNTSLRRMNRTRRVKVGHG